MGKESTMAFEAITTQEQLDGIISDRLKRERETVKKEFTEKYKDYDSLKEKNAEYEKQIGVLNQTIEENSTKAAEYEKTTGELKAKIKGYETASVKMRIAHETGIPYELAPKLSGDDEEAIRKDAENMSKFVQKQKWSTPLADPEPEPANNKAIAMKNLLKGLKGE